VLFDIVILRKGDADGVGSVLADLALCWIVRDETLVCGSLFELTELSL